MRRALAIVLILAAFTLSTACKGRKDALEGAYKEWDAALVKAKDNGEKLAATRSFLDRFPDSKHTEDAAETLAYLLSDALGRPAEADEFLVALAGKVMTPETRTAILRIRLGVLGALKDGARLRQAVAEFSQGRDLDFAERSAVADAALACGEWELAASTADAALPLATPEGVRADNPTSKMNEQRVADTARRRRVEMLGAKGWALANLGRHDDAVAVLREAQAADFHGYMGNTESSAGSYLGRALAMAGKRDEAEQVLAVASLYGGDKPANAALRERFPAGAAGDGEFDAWVAAQRLKLARTVDDFTLPDYAGTPHTFSKLRNGEVTLLSFWFPT
jgi:hypothetical protein